METRASEIVKQYHQLVVALRQLKEELEHRDFFSGVPEKVHEEQRHLERLIERVDEIRLVADWYRDFA